MSWPIDTTPGYLFLHFPGPRYSEDVDGFKHVPYVLTPKRPESFIPTTHYDIHGCAIRGNINFETGATLTYETKTTHSSACLSEHHLQEMCRDEGFKFSGPGVYTTRTSLIQVRRNGHTKPPKDYSPATHHPSVIDACGPQYFVDQWIRRRKSN